MRVTKFYVGFPPAVVKRTFGATEYGIGLIPLGGFVRIVGMGRPRGKDLRACAEAAERAAERRPADQPDLLTPALERAGRALDAGDPAASGDALARLGAALEHDAELVDAERVGWCRKELERVGEDADPRAYWRQATWRRITAIVAGPAANVIAAFVILVTFYGLGVPRYVRDDSRAAGAGRLARAAHGPRAGRRRDRRAGQAREGLGCAAARRSRRPRA